MRELSNSITYTQILTFKAIYEAGNISRAAKKLNISPASVSHSLKTLERQIEEPLFIRTTRAIKPTETGVQLYESSRSAIEELSSAVATVCEKNQPPRGKLTLNMAKNIYDVFLKDILRDFRREYPGIQLEITLSDTMDQYVEKTIDIGFRFGETVNETMIARPLSPLLPNVKTALVASQKYLEQYGEPETVSDLKNHSFIKFRAPTSEAFLPVKLHASSDPGSEVVTLHNLPTSMAVNNTEVMTDMALQGFGIAHLMNASVQPQLDSGALKPILEQHWCDIPTVYMYYAPENKQTRRIRCFLDYINSRLSTIN